MGWTLTPWLGSRIDFSFLRESVFVSSVLRIGPATSSLVKYASTRLLSLVGLDYPSSVGDGAFRLFWYCSRATYAQFMEDSDQLYGDMVGH